MDNLNTHGIESLYTSCPPQEARALAERLEIHYTPKHDSRLNIAEIELSALCGQCLNCRMGDLATVREQMRAWEQDRNNRDATVDWQFNTRDARIKLKSLYPKTQPIHCTGSKSTSRPDRATTARKLVPSKVNSSFRSIRSSPPFQTEQSDRRSRLMSTHM